MTLAWHSQARGRQTLPLAQLSFAMHPFPSPEGAGVACAHSGGCPGSADASSSLCASHGFLLWL